MLRRPPRRSCGDCTARNGFVRVAMCVGVMCVLANTAHALDPQRTLTQYIHRIWQLQQGLPQPSIYALHQAGDGYVWLGTQAGLARFDGVKFTVVQERGGVSFAGLWVTRIVEDARRTVVDRHEERRRVSPDRRRGRAIGPRPKACPRTRSMRCCRAATNSGSPRPPASPF
ncbi:MAG: hypothetical protein QM811_03375 [Pirellulales bacterium]